MGCAHDTRQTYGRHDVLPRAMQNRCEPVCFKYLANMTGRRAGRGGGSGGCCSGGGSRELLGGELRQRAGGVGGRRRCDPSAGWAPRQAQAATHAQRAQSGARGARGATPAQPQPLVPSASCTGEAGCSLLCGRAAGRAADALIAFFGSVWSTVRGHFLAAMLDILLLPGPKGRPGYLHMKVCHADTDR